MEPLYDIRNAQIAAKPLRCRECNIDPLSKYLVGPDSVSVENDDLDVQHLYGESRFDIALAFGKGVKEIIPHVAGAVPGSKLREVYTLARIPPNLQHLNLGDTEACSICNCFDSWPY